MVALMVATVRRRGAAAAVLAWLCAQAAHALPSFDEVKASFRPSDTVLLSREGEELQRLRTDASVRRGQWVALADVSPALREALVRSEDQRFYAHSGVDWRAVSAAAWGNLWHQRTRGASTITMQLAGLLDADWRAGPGGRTLAQKVGQGVAAQRLEKSWRNNQILEAYLNLVPFRGEIVGIDALSRSLFGKAAQGLDARESAIAAALVRAPNARAEQVARRACTVLQALQALQPQGPQGPGQTGSARQGRPPSDARSDVQASPQSVCAGLDAYTAAMLQRRAWDASAGVAPHFMRYLLRTLRAQPAGRAAAQEQGAAVPVPTPAPTPPALRSSLRAGLQRFAVQALTQQLRELQGRGVEDGAVLVLDNASGEVLAWVGSSGTLSQAAEVDGVQALRQPGSTLKPFLYAQALAEHRLTAASLLDDAPTAIATPGGLYVPQNYDRRFRGWVSVRTALAASLNVPAVRTLVLVSPDAFHQQLRTLGLPLRESGGYFGYSLALGSPEVSLLQLTQAYRTLALGGRTGPLRLQPAASAQQAAGLQRVLDGRAAFIVGDILSDGNARAPTFGTDSVLATRFWTAVKTGTSKDMRDNWALGWSQRYTVGVWVGNASGAAMHEVSGSSGAAPVWAALMRYLHAHEPSRAPAPPPGVRRVAVRFAAPGTALDAAPEAAPEAAREEWFIAGTEQAVFAIDAGACHADGKSARGPKGLKNSAPMPCGPSTQATARITAPTPGSIIALDPDVPPARQRLQLRAAGPGSARAQWRLDGKPLGRGARVSWLPWPGRHVLQLADAQGGVLDELRFEVRGAEVRAGH